MKISQIFTIAVHALLYIQYYQGRKSPTSEMIAKSIGINPVIVRKVLGRLKAAGFVSIKAGKGGASLVRSPSQISLLDIYRASGVSSGELFAFHGGADASCPVGKNIRAVLDGPLENARQKLEQSLSGVSLLRLSKNLAALSEADPSV